MVKYLGVSAVSQKGGIKLWRASMHGKLLGMGRSPQAAAWMVCRMAGGKSIEEFVIQSAVQGPSLGMRGCGGASLGRSL